MTRRRKIIGQFAARTIEMLESPAYRALSLSAHRILARLEIEMAHHGGPRANGALVCTYDDFVSYGVHRHSVAAAIRELGALRFVEVTEKGRGGFTAARRPNKFRLTYVGTEHADATHEWRRIDTEQEARTIAQTAREPVKKKLPVMVFAKTSAGNRH
jgi:hypothetical protein